MNNFLGSTVILVVSLYVSKGDSDGKEIFPKSGELYTKNETKLFVDGGSDVTLNCICSHQSKSTFTGPVIPSLMDKHHVQGPYTDGFILNPKLNKTKFKIVSGNNNNECNLKIFNFSKEEDGIYQCQYTIMDNIKILEYNVAIKRPPMKIEILNLTDNNIMTWRAGQSLRLVCKVESGKPLEKLSWSSNGIILKEGGPGTIIYCFVPRKRDNMKLITCSANNPSLLQPLMQEVYLDITYKPIIKITIKPQQVNLTEGHSGIICCEWTSNPPGIMTTWLKNSLQRQNGNQKCLKFSPFLRNDSGSFTCVVKNTIGQSRLSTELTIFYPPKVTVKYKLGTNYIDFTCNAAGEPTRYIFSQWEHESEFHQLIRRVNGTGLGTLRVNRTKNPLKQFEDSGYYICRVSNGIPDIEGNSVQEGKAFVTIEGLPIYLLENMNVQYGTFGHEATICLQIYNDSELFSNTIRRINADNDLETSIQEESVKGHIMFHGVNVMVAGTKITFKIHMKTAEDFTNYTINICNKKDCNNMTLEVRSSDSPEPPKNVFVVSYSTSLAVKWKPGFNGGFKQKFYIEYSTEKTKWKVVGPIDHTILNIEEEFAYTLTNLRPATQYFIRMFSENKIGQSNKTNITTADIAALRVTFENFSVVKPVVAIFVVAVLGSVVGFLVFKKKIGMCATRQDFSDTDFSHEETQDTSVENQLYQLAEPVELTNERGHGRAMFRPMQNNERNLVAESELQNSQDISEGNGRDLEEGEYVQINESNLNYAEVMFSTKPKTNTIVVHGKEDKTIYSEIDHLKRAEALPSSSESESDSDDDFMYIDGIQIFTRKKTV